MGEEEKKKEEEEEEKEKKTEAEKKKKKEEAEEEKKEEAKGAIAKEHEGASVKTQRTSHGTAEMEKGKEMNVGTKAEVVNNLDLRQRHPQTEKRMSDQTVT